MRGGGDPGWARRGADLREQLVEEMPAYISSAVRFQIAVANQLQLPLSDVHAIGALLEFGPIGVGRLAELMGMTTGATTRLVDRLERGGYVSRVRDRQDRRRVVLHVVPERIAEVARYYESMGERWREQLAGYTEPQLRFLLEFLRQGRAHALEETAALRVSGRPHGSRPRNRE
jgi:DNA-binding MarR family transcriptional regulator